MMKAIAAILAFSCLVHYAYASIAPFDCPNGPSSRCTAVAGLSILTTAGTCSGTSSADCTVWTQSQSVFEGEFNTLYSNADKICDSVFVTARAEAVAQAIAKIYANTFVQVECTGTGFACGWAFAGGEGFALSVAEAVAFAAADASVNTGTDVVNALCFSDIRAIGAAFASASATSFTRTCTDGGLAEDWERNFASAIQTVIADAIATAFASRCTGPTDTTGRSECTGESGVIQIGGTGGTGDFCAGTGSITTICTGEPAGRCCFGSSAFCPPVSFCPSCQLPWQRQSGNVWKKNNGELCLCA